MKDRSYSDWFGAGDTNKDVADIVEQHGEPDRVLYESGGYMAAIIYKDCVVVVGYDGNEYCHTFVMDEEQ